MTLTVRTSVLFPCGLEQLVKAMGFNQTIIDPLMNPSVIPSLYAAGSNGQSGLALEGHGHHLGRAFTSGRSAGRNASEGVGTP